MPRRAFAKPAVLLTVLSAAGAATLLLSAEPVYAPASRPPVAVEVGFYPPEPFTESEPVPSNNIPLADGRKVSLAELRPGMALEVGCDLRGVDWAGVNLAGVRMVRADLRGADLHGAYLHQADLCGANLAGANLRGADLVEAGLDGADLAGADLRGTNLNTPWLDLRFSTSHGYVQSSPKLQAALYDRHTRWPAGFRPEVHGARLVG